MDESGLSDSLRCPCKRPALISLILSPINKLIAYIMANIERLQKLADHLLHGQLGHKTFDFDSYNTGAYDHRGCGTAGCAIGECPIVWPDQWAFRYLRPKLKGVSILTSVREHGCDFFELTERQYEALFIPNRQDKIDLPILDGSATKEQVANNILLFIERNK